MKTEGLLERVRKPELFRGEIGEDILIAPPKDSLGSKKLLIIGLGELAEFFPPQRMQLVGEILIWRQRLGVAHPFFAPTILDGASPNSPTGEVAEQVIGGFLRAAATDKVLRMRTPSPGQGVTALT